MARYIFVTGGVVSSLGKGLSSASLAYLLKSQGFKVRVRKMDPYLNVDPGTMSPFQHGEVFVTDDGAETDLDLGHYERFTDISSTKNDNITTGKIPKIDELEQTVEFIKKKFKGKLPKILYGGSVNPENIRNLKNITNLDGFLIGGASQNSKKFIDIVKKTYN